MKLLRQAARRGLGVVDRAYQRRHGLRRAGPLLHIGLTRYDGPRRRFDDGTELIPGDPLGTLHFDNACIAGLDGGSPTATGLRFRRLLFASLRTLAELPRADEAFRDVKAYRGISWIRHGENIGFVHEAAPKGLRSLRMELHVRLLVWAFAPEGGTALAARPELTISWMTQRALTARFGKRHERAA